MAPLERESTIEIAAPVTDSPILIVDEWEIWKFNVLPMNEIVGIRKMKINDFHVHLFTPFIHAVYIDLDLVIKFYNITKAF